ncbi:type II toxin-antitoxin system RelE/ParE family toxin [Mesorhizobium sp. L48C026A00]|uniref:type II toxin-antitoxin system RelE/ParE family toxin n=1 Tax=Mesorhizobium sp. L48C026A00 TaxID=1287182 RepID=UPI000687BA4E|nr:type II toxin-antitoxin system RelE/ParE family toxin [Mesorhizobium sp. L48C026A00]
MSDADLCKAIEQVALGQADDLGGGVFKKRLNDNRHRSIILAKSGRFWVYEYVFAKQDRANIDDKELTQFRKLAKAYAELTDRQIERLVSAGDFLEICHDQKQ